MAMTAVMALVFFPWLMAIAAASDLFTMTISNRISLALVAGFFVMAMLIGMDLATMGLHVAAGALGLVVAFFLFAMNWIGGGDAKLAAAIALWLGWDQSWEYILWASIVGGELTILIVWLRSMNVPDWLTRIDWIARLLNPKNGVPYGIALAGAGLAMYVDTPFVRTVLGSIS